MTKKYFILSQKDWKKKDYSKEKETLNPMITHVAFQPVEKSKPGEFTTPPVEDFIGEDIVFDRELYRIPKDTR